MNNLIRIIFILLVLLFLGCSSSDEIHSSYSFEPGAEVYIEMNDNEKYEGELLRVDDGTMILCEVYNATEQELMDAVDSWIPIPPRDVEKPFLMPVEDVFSITGRGTVATGRIETGIVRTSEEVQIIGLGIEKKSVCTGVEMFRKILDEGLV